MRFKREQVARSDWSETNLQLATGILSSTEKRSKVSLKASVKNLPVCLRGQIGKSRVDWLPATGRDVLIRIGVQ